MGWGQNTWGEDSKSTWKGKGKGQKSSKSWQSDSYGKSGYRHDDVHWSDARGTSKNRAKRRSLPRSKSGETVQQILYQKCEDFEACGGWEWCRNHKTTCRLCDGPLEVPPKEFTDAQAVSRDANTRPKNPRKKDPLTLLVPGELAALEARFPGFAKHVNDKKIPPPPPPPGEVLHGAQTACQISFKCLRAAECKVSETQTRCTSLYEQLTTAIAELRDAKTELAAAQAKHDVTSKEALKAVEQTRAPLSATSSVQIAAEMLFKLTPQQASECYAQIEQMQAAKGQPPTFGPNSIDTDNMDMYI